jgi:Holliday junction resolvase RusA-like endonuclease
MSSVSFFVAGVAIPQGSSRAFMVKGRPIITSSNRNLSAWRARIAHKAQAIQDVESFYKEGKYAYSVEANFVFPRTKSMGKKNIRHTVRPDADKCSRAVGDSLTGILIPDDAQIDDWKVTKEYLDFSGDDRSPGVTIYVERKPLELL